MERTCLRTFAKDGLLFIEGCDYKITYNKIDGRLYIYSAFGQYTDISKQTISEYFI